MVRLRGLGGGGCWFCRYTPSTTEAGGGGGDGSGGAVGGDGERAGWVWNVGVLVMG